MISWRRNLFWIWVSLFLSMAGFAFAYPIFPFYLTDVYHVTGQQARDVYISLFVFAGNLGFLLFSPLWGRMADIYGRKVMMTRANLCAAVLLPLISVMPTPDALVVLRFFIGAFAGVVSAAMTLVACSTPEKHRGMAMGSISSAIFSGNLAGMVLGGFCASEFGYNWTFSLCGIMMAVAGFLSGVVVKEDKNTLSKEKMRYLPKFELPQLGKVWYLMILTMWMGLVQCMDNPFVPVLVDNILQQGPAAAMRWNGILGGVCAAAGIFGGFIIGTLADRYPGQKVGIWISYAGALFLLPQAFCYSLGLLFAERVVMTFFVSGFSPIMQTWLSLTTDPQKRGIYFGYATSSRAIGWLLGGIIGLCVTMGFGTRAIFGAGAFAIVIMALGIKYTHSQLPYPSKS